MGGWGGLMSVVYNRGKARIAAVGWPNLDVRALVLTDADTLPAGASNPDLNFVSELLAVSGVTEAAEVGGLTGYQRKTLAGEAVIEADATDEAQLDFTDISYAETESGRWVAVVLYEEGASDAARALIGLHDLSSPLTTNGGPVDLQVPTNGAYGLT